MTWIPSLEKGLSDVVASLAASSAAADGVTIDSIQSAAADAAGGPREPPAGNVRPGSVARTLARRFRLGHPLAHLRLHGVEVEARPALHRRVVEERLDLLAH